MPFEKLPEKTVEFIFLFFGSVNISGMTHKKEGRYGCPQNCKGVYLWPDHHQGARVLVIYT
jgi:hypothetical protein